MALTLPARVVANVADEDGIEGTVTAYILLDPTHSLAEADEELWGWLAALDDVTGARIVDARVELLPGLPGGLKTLAEAGCSAMHTGVLNFSAEASPRRYAFGIPALSNDPAVVSGGKPVLTPGSPVATLVAQMLVISSAVQNTNADYQRLEVLLDAFIAFRQYSEQLARRSAALA